MADEEKNETTDETKVSETTAADAGAAVPEEVSDTTPVTADADATAGEEVSDTEPVADAAPAAEEVSDTSTEPVADAAPAAEEVSGTSTTAPPAKKPRSGKHVPRSLRRTRTKSVREKPVTRKAITRTARAASQLGRRQERRGVVVSDKGDKTIIVKVDVIKSHPKYKKVVRRAVKFHAHDEANTAGIGDTVRIVETRPLSKTKRWRLAEIVEKAR